MKADALNPRELFDGKTHFMIPSYQRPYVWNEEDQWAPLWDDIVRVAESYLSAAAQGTGDTARHFLGALVYESKPHVVGDVTRHEVIDGQQRTTTLQLIIDAVHSVLAERGHEEVAADLEEIILNGAPRLKDKPERFKLWPSRNDREAFERAMDDSSEAIADHRVSEAHAFFRSEAGRWIIGEPDDDGEHPSGAEGQRAWALSGALQTGLYVVAINLTGHDDAQLIFETLNDRGTPLLKADLIKNWVYKIGSKVGAEVDRWPDTHWIDFDDDWWRAEIVQGRHARSRIDIFLQYWLTMRTQEEVKTDQVFRSFTQYAKPLMVDPVSADELLGALRRDADTFRDFTEFAPSSPQGSFYARVIETMELAATSPLLMWFVSENHQVPEEQVRTGLIALESWAIRRTLLRLTMKDVNRMMVAILKLVVDAGVDRAGAAVQDYLAAQTADARLWPTDRHVLAELPGTRLYGSVRQGRLKVVLWAIEESLRTRFSEHVPVPSKLEVEHVMPRGWRAHWDTVPPLSADDAVSRDRSLNTLGNLTLVTQSLNGSLSNRPWTDGEAASMSAGGQAGKGKRTLLMEHSLLHLSKRLVTEHPEQWTDSDIEERSRDLAHAVCSVWPRPE